MSVTEDADKLLMKAYKEADGGLHVFMRVDEVADEAGVPRDRMNAAFQYLLSHGLIDTKGIGGMFGLNVAGVQAVEAVLTDDATMRKAADRYAFLKYSYTLSKGDPTGLLQVTEVGDSLGWERSRTMAAFEHLSAAGLLRPKTFGGGYSIEPVAVDLVERADADPDSPTAHFPPRSSLNIYIRDSFNDSTLVNAIIGSPGGSISSGDVFILESAARAELLEALSALGEAIRSAEGEAGVGRDVLSHIEAMKDEARKPRPNHTVLQALWTSAKEFAGRVLQRAGVQVLAQNVSELLDRLT